MHTKCMYTYRYVIYIHTHIPYAIIEKKDTFPTNSAANIGIKIILLQTDF